MYAFLVLVLSDTGGTASIGDYGICAHLQRWEYPVYRQELDIIKELGIGFVRFDFDWAMIEPRRGGIPL